MINIAIVGLGAFGIKHIEALQKIADVEISSVVGRTAIKAQKIAEQYQIANHSDDLGAALANHHIDAVILASPTQLHAAQATQVMKAGKHVLIEIPMADNLLDSEALVALQQKTGVVAMCGHVRRFNPSHQYVHNLIKNNAFHIQQMDIQTYFFRRENINAKGEPRSWTDHLLWHHSAHSIDLFMYQTGENITEIYAVQGPKHSELGIAMDMAIIMKTPTGKIATLSLSFNNDGPLGTFFRYIGDTGTYIARYDDLVDGKENPIDVSKVDISTNGIELIDREFIRAIQTGDEPNGSLQQCLPTMQVLDKIERMIEK